VFPRPLQQPHPPFWIAGQSADSIAATVARGYKCITGGSSAPTGRVVENWNAFRDAVDATGAGWPQEFAVQSQVYVSDSEEDAREQLQHALWHFRMVDALRNNRQKVVKGITVEEKLAQEPDPDLMYDEWLLFGTPDTVSRKLERLLDLTGITYLNCVFSIGRLPKDKITASMNRFATEVMPAFRDRVGARAPAAPTEPSSLR
jgi:alkanesulfonate monooxygenase SsuD/methylene tetrahydromethanopterin reductase-like flavin-dependent oxidoreductase (luciferase family)